MKCYFSLLISVWLLGCQQADQQAPGLPFYNTPDFTPRWLTSNDPKADTLHHLSGFAFQNQNNQTITEQTVKGKIHVADFFFTRCPGLCPRLTRSMSEVQAAFRNDPQVLLLSYSVTPDRDSVAQLRQYATKHQIIDGKWHLLTGNRASIYQLARQSYFADENLGVQKGEADFLHTENLLLIDQKLRIRGIYNGTLPLEIQQLIEDIRVLEKESD